MKSEQANGRLARCALELQEYNFKIRHMTGSANSNADALSRPPIAHAEEEPRVAALAVVQTLPYGFDSDSGNDRVTYASGSEGRHSEGGSDSGPSVPVELPCEVCASPDNDGTMVLYDNCNKGFHTTCLNPPLPGVPKGVWLCPICERGADLRTDITQDFPTLQYVKHGTFAQSSSEQEKTRIRAKSCHYSYDSNQLVHKASGKPIPEVADRKGIVAQCHSYGHFGIDKSSNIVQNHYWWWGLKDQFKEHVKSCDPCKLGLAKFNEPMEMQPIAVQGIYHKVGIDMIGPLQTSLSGNKHIITAVDYMSKNIEAEAVPNKSSKTTSEFFYKDIVCRHGTPVDVVTDQGGEFQGEFQALLDKCGIDHRLTSPYHPQANGLTERANQTLTRSLIKMTKEDPDNWDKQIPTILMGYRATKQASTKYSPSFMLHGHEMVMPINNKGRTVSAEHGELSEACLANLFGPSAAVLEDCLVNIDQAQDRQVAHYAKRQLHGAIPAKTVVAPPETVIAVPTLPINSSHTPAYKSTITTTPTAPIIITDDVPSSSTAVPIQASITPMLESKVAVIKQEPLDSPDKRVDSPHHQPKRRKKTEIQVDDFIVVKVHKMVRKDGNRKGKLAPKAEGPYLVAGFTDDSKQVAIIKDAGGQTWTKRVADLSLWA